AVGTSIAGQLSFISNSSVNSGGGGSITLQAAPSVTGNFILTLPGQSGTLCTDNPLSNCSIAGDAKYLFKNATDSSTVNSASTQYTFTNQNSGSVLTLQGNSGTAFLVNNFDGTIPVFTVNTLTNLTTID